MKLLVVLTLCNSVAFARPAIDGSFPALAVLPPRPAPFPPGFEELLPEEAKSKLVAAHDDRSLSFDERRDRIESVFDELPREILEKLPLPPGLARLSPEAQEPFRALHLDRSIGWRERQSRVHDLIKKLTEEEQRLVHPPAPLPFGALLGSPGLHGGSPPPMMPGGLPPRPPPGFELVLSPTLFKQLLAVHENSALSIDGKKQQLDKVLRLVPQDQLERLPLPPGFEKLPAETLQRVRKLMHDFTLDWDTRHEKVDKFVRSLPREERRLLRPQVPGFEALPEEVRDQIDDLFDNHNLNPVQRHQKIHDILQSLPDDIRSKLPPPPPVAFPSFPSPPSGQKFQASEPQNEEFAVKEQGTSFV